MKEIYSIKIYEKYLCRAGRALGTVFGKCRTRRVIKGKAFQAAAPHGFGDQLEPPLRHAQRLTDHVDLRMIVDVNVLKQESA